MHGGAGGVSAQSYLGKGADSGEGAQPRGSSKLGMGTYRGAQPEEPKLGSYREGPGIRRKGTQPKGNIPGGPNVVTS